MKKILSLTALLAVLALLPAMAQRPTVRNGNTYLVGSETMNKKAYEGYLKNTCPEAFSLFHNGRSVAAAGWAFFGTGLAMEIAGPAMMIASTVQAANNETEPDMALTLSGYGLMASGAAVNLSGIIMLGVGYNRMHRAANVYNTNCANRPQAYLTPSSKGLGLALHF